MSASVALSSVAELNPRQPQGLDPSGEATFLPMSSVSEDGRILRQERRSVGEVRKGFTYFERGDLVVAKITPCFENGKAALLDSLECPMGFGSTEFHVIRPDEQVLDAKYLYYLIRSPRFKFLGENAMTGAAGQKRVPAEFLAKYEIPLLPLTEQKRIAAILDKADCIRRKRQHAIELADEFLRAAFLEMFGDPVTNPKGWDRKPVHELLADTPNAIRTGPFGSQLRHSEFKEQGQVSVLGIDNVVNNDFRWAAPRFLPRERFTDFARYTVYPEDVLITIMGTTGRVAVAPPDLPTCMSTKHLCVLTLDRDLMDPWFFWATIMFDQVVRGQTATAGGGAIMEGWNMGIIKKLNVRVPPIDLQRRFRFLRHKLQNIIAGHRGAGEHSNTLFRSLSQRAFSACLGRSSYETSDS